MKKLIRLSALLTFLAFFSQHTIAQLDTARLFMFGHSLMDHRPPLIATPSDETTIAHWMALIAKAANKDFAATGEFGFMGSHAANLPPDSQWGYDSVTTSWDASTTPLGQANIDQVMFTPLNYVQWQAANINYINSTFSPLSASVAVMDYMTAQLPDSPRMYIYENWPDMSGYLGGGSFPPNATQLGNYYQYSQLGFHNWFLEYQDSLVAARPSINVKMIPVGPTLTHILTQSPYNTIPVTEMYEDDAPHGRASLYFLAGLITYMAIYEEKAPSTYSPPTIIHATIRNNYSTIVDLIWAQLQNFNYSSGESRVFFGVNLVPLLIEDDFSESSELAIKHFAVYPNPSQQGLIQLQLPQNIIPQHLTITDICGREVLALSKTNIPDDLRLDIHSLESGMYFVNIQVLDGVYVSRFVIDKK